LSEKIISVASIATVVAIRVPRIVRDERQHRSGREPDGKWSDDASPALGSRCFFPSRVLSREGGKRVSTRLARSLVVIPD
jgi:hypothetical protein